jgi:rubrerythrin
MPDSSQPDRIERPITAVRSALKTAAAGETKMLCERCGAEAYRMHAVWRCPACGFKSDCCGW